MSAEQFERTLGPRQRRYYGAVAAEARAIIRDDSPGTSTREAIDTAFMCVDPADYGLALPDERAQREPGYVYLLVRR